MRHRAPTHPGAILREDVLPSLPGMSVSAFARNLGVSRQTLHAVLAERSGVSAEMALRLGTLLGNGAQLWLDMQTQFDLWHAEVKLHDELGQMQIAVVHAARTIHGQRRIRKHIQSQCGHGFQRCRTGDGG